MRAGGETRYQHARSLTRALLAAKSITYTVTGASGMHFADVIARLGIADVIKAKAIVRDGLAGELAACGEVDIAVQQISELMQVKGIDIIGPLPDALQKVSVFSAGVFTTAKNPANAAALIARLVDAGDCRRDHQGRGARAPKHDARSPSRRREGSGARPLRSDEAFQQRGAAARAIDEASVWRTSRHSCSTRTHSATWGWARRPFDRRSQPPSGGEKNVECGQRF